MRTWPWGAEKADKETERLGFRSLTAIVASPLLFAQQSSVVLSSYYFLREKKRERKQSSSLWKIAFIGSKGHFGLQKPIFIALLESETSALRLLLGVLIFFSPHCESQLYFNALQLINKEMKAEAGETRTNVLIRPKYLTAPRSRALELRPFPCLLL